MNVSTYEQPERWPTYITVAIEPTGEKRYTEYDPRYKFPIKSWTIYIDGSKRITFAMDPVTS